MECIDKIMEKMRRMTLWDYGLFKTSLALLGIIIGAFIAGFVKQYIWYFVAITVISYAALLYRIFRE